MFSEKPLVEYKNNLTISAYKMLEQLIVRSDLKQGSIITEKEISNRLGIGRMPVREALKKMENAQVVEFLPRKGIYICVWSPEMIIQLLEIWYVLTKLAVRNALKFSSRYEQEQIGQLAMDFRIATQQGEMMDIIGLMEDILNAICNCGGNTMLVNSMMPLTIVIKRQLYTYFPTNNQLSSQLTDKQLYLAEALAERNELLAVKMLDALYGHLKEFALAGISRGVAGP